MEPRAPRGRGNPLSDFLFGKIALKKKLHGRGKKRKKMIDVKVVREYMLP